MPAIKLEKRKELDSFAHVQSLEKMPNY